MSQKLWGLTLLEVIVLPTSEGFLALFVADLDRFSFKLKHVYCSNIMLFG